LAAKPRVVILGAGFGGLFAAQGLERVAADVTIVDRPNYHLFQPLLYQVATAGLAPSDVAWPIRSILSRQRNTTVLLDEVTGIALERREVLLKRERLSFDYLVVATGARHSYFGHEDWAPVAPGLKTIDDATHIRRRILTAFEQAEMSDDERERERLLRFVIVGGGATGVELAGTIAELAHHTLAADFRHIDPRAATVTLVEAGPRLLPFVSQASSDYARKALERLGVDVRLGTPVTHCDEDGVTIGAQLVPCATVIWAAGVAASPAARWLGAECDRAGRVIVGGDLRISANPDVFVIGHCEAHRGRARTASVPLSSRGLSRDDRPALGGHRVSASEDEGPARVVDLGHRTHLLPRRRAEPVGRLDPLALGIPDLRPRRAADHGRRAGRLAETLRIPVQRGSNAGGVPNPIDAARAVLVGVPGCRVPDARAQARLEQLSYARHVAELQRGHDHDLVIEILLSMARPELPVALTHR
jgi:NADH dehydrogenase